MKDKRPLPAGVDIFFYNRQTEAARPLCPFGSWSCLFSCSLLRVIAPGGLDGWDFICFPLKRKKNMHDARVISACLIVKIFDVPK